MTSSEPSGWTDEHGPGLAERELVDQFLLRREEQAFRELYQRYTPAIQRLAWQMIGSQNGDAEEVVQVTWTRAIENLAGFRWQSTFKSWLTGIAINCCREARRARRRQPTASLEEIDNLPSAERPLGEVSPRALAGAIDWLPERYREVLILHDIEGYTHEEIGRVLGIESGTSKSQLCRARRAVRARLARPTNGDGAA